jgi:hypothetical protein
MFYSGESAQFFVFQVRDPGSIFGPKLELLEILRPVVENFFIFCRNVLQLFEMTKNVNKNLC